MHTLHRNNFDVNRFMERQPEDTVLILKNHPFVKQSFLLEEQWEGTECLTLVQGHINDLMLIKQPSYHRLCKAQVYLGSKS